MPNDIEKKSVDNLSDPALYLPPTASSLDDAEFNDWDMVSPSSNTDTSETEAFIIPDSDLVVVETASSPSEESKQPPVSAESPNEINNNPLVNGAVEVAVTVKETVKTKEEEEEDSFVFPEFIGDSVNDSISLESKEADKNLPTVDFVEKGEEVIVDYSESKYAETKRDFTESNDSDLIVVDLNDYPELLPKEVNELTESAFVEHHEAMGEEFNKFLNLLDQEHKAFYNNYDQVSYEEWLKPYLERAREGAVMLGTLVLVIIEGAVYLGGKLLAGVVITSGEVLAAGGDAIAVVGNAMNLEGVEKIREGLERAAQHLQGIGNGIEKVAVEAVAQVHSVAAYIRFDHIDRCIDALDQYDYLFEEDEATSLLLNHVAALKNYLRSKYDGSWSAPDTIKDIEKILTATHEVLSTAKNDPKTCLKHIQALEKMANKKEVEVAGILKAIATAVKVMVVIGLIITALALFTSCPPVGLAVISLCGIFVADKLARGRYKKDLKDNWGPREEAVSGVCQQARFFVNSQPKPATPVALNDTLLSSDSNPGESVERESKFNP